jgi:hypothetical protein
VLGGVRLGGAQSFDEAHGCDADTGAREAQVFVGAQVRDGERGQTTRNVTDDRHAVLIEGEDFDDRDAEDHRRERPGHDRRESSEPEDKRERGHSDPVNGPTTASAAPSSSLRAYRAASVSGEV